MKMASLLLSYATLQVLNGVSELRSRFQSNPAFSKCRLQKIVSFHNSLQQQEVPMDERHACDVLSSLKVLVDRWDWEQQLGRFSGQI